MSEQKKDFLKPDPPVVVSVPGPEFKPVWTVLSFISPQEMIEKRFIYDSNQFLYHDVNRQIMDTTTNIVTDINRSFHNSLEKKIAAYKTSTNETYKAAAAVLEGLKEDLTLDEDEFVNKVLRTYRIDEKELNDRFQMYKIQNSKELESEFNKLHGDATSVRGFKVRGCYETLGEARARAKYVREHVEPAISSFVAPMGYWLPWNPNADAIQDQDYMLPELNDLMEKYQRNVEQRNEFFDKNKRSQMENSKTGRNEQLRERLRQRLVDKKNQIVQGQLDTFQKKKKKRNRKKNKGETKSSPLPPSTENN